MRYIVQINKALEKPFVSIATPEETEQIHTLTNFIEKMMYELIVEKEGEIFKLSMNDIVYIETVDRKTFLYTNIYAKNYGVHTDSTSDCIVVGKFTHQKTNIFRMSIKK